MLNAASVLRTSPTPSSDGTELAADGCAWSTVDEAQAMPEHTLKDCAAFEPETEKRKLLQVILVGQPELDASLRAKVTST